MISKFVDFIYLSVFFIHMSTKKIILYCYLLLYLSCFFDVNYFFFNPMEEKYFLFMNDSKFSWYLLLKCLLKSAISVVYWMQKFFEMWEVNKSFFYINQYFTFEENDNICAFIHNKYFFLLIHGVVFALLVYKQNIFNF